MNVRQLVGHLQSLRASERPSPSPRDDAPAFELPQTPTPNPPDARDHSRALRPAGNEHAAQESTSSAPHVAFRDTESHVERTLAGKTVEGVCVPPPSGALSIAGTCGRDAGTSVPGASDHAEADRTLADCGGCPASEAPVRAVVTALYGQAPLAGAGSVGPLVDNAIPTPCDAPAESGHTNEMHLDPSASPQPIPVAATPHSFHSPAASDVNTLSLLWSAAASPPGTQMAPTGAPIALARMAIPEAASTTDSISPQASSPAGANVVVTASLHGAGSGAPPAPIVTPTPTTDVFATHPAPVLAAGAPAALPGPTPTPPGSPIASVPTLPSSAAPREATAQTTESDRGLHSLFEMHDPGSSPAGGAVGGFIPPRGVEMPSPAIANAGPVALPATPDDGFDDSFGQRIVWMTEQRITQAEMRVSPEGVGAIDVRLQVDGNRVTAQFSAANAEVRQALEASMGRLRDMLGQHGMELSDAHVGREGTGRQGAGTPRPDGLRTAGDDGEPVVTTLRSLRARGLIDLYA